MSTGLPATIRGVLLRDLAALGRTLDLYPDDASLWRDAPGLPNRGGTLVLHCCGNLRHYAGAVLGGTGYVRDRAAEFSTRDVPRAELARLVTTTAAEVDRALAELPEDRLQEDYPEIVGGHRIPTRDFLVQLCAHLAYHLGQLDYHRRFMTGDPTGVGAVAVAELPSARPVTAVMPAASAPEQPPG